MLQGRGEPEGSAGQIERRRGDEVTLARFEKIALPHLDAVYRLARALASGDAEADDLVQETFIRAFQGFAGFELREYGARPWLFRILHNVFYTLKGRQRRQPALLDQVDIERAADAPDESLSGSSPGELDWDRFDEEVKEAVGRLPCEYRTTLLLWSLEGYTYREIADICDCALGTVMSRLYRARRLMARHLRDYAREHKWPTERFQ